MTADAVVSEKIEPPRLVAEDLRVQRGDAVILRGVTLEARGGEVLGVLGPSGAGKSTLFRALVGELPRGTTQGRVVLDGHDVTGLPLWARARAGIGYVPQTPSVLWDLTVLENLRAFARVAEGARRTLLESVRRTAFASREAKRAETEAAERLAGRVSLETRLDVRAGELSGGERRRLELARVLVVRPRVLVCDEPFAGVDPQQAGRLGDLLQGLALEGVTVLLADHHVEEALRVCTRAVLLLDGAVAVDGTPDAFRDHPLVTGRYLGSWTRSLPPPTPRT